MKFRRFFWGLVFILAAAWLVASKVFGIGIDIAPWRILVGVVLLYAFIESIVGFSIFGILASLAGLYWLFAGYLNMLKLPLFPLFCAVVMLSIGIYILTGFGGKRRRHRHGQCDCGDGTTKFAADETKDMDGDDVYRRLNCGQSEVYLHSKNLKKAEFVCFAGDMRIYFSGAQLDPGGASVKVECNMGSLKLYIPKTWKVTENIVVVIGGTDEKNKHENTQYSDSQGPLLAITGIVRMGAVEIIYV
jgi:predicted membrane protein